MTDQDIKPRPDNEADPLLIGYLDAIVALTCQREALGLTTSLIDSLCQHVRAARFRLLTISNFNKIDDDDESGLPSVMVRDWLDPLTDPVPIQSDPDLLACARTRERISRRMPGTGGRRLILPIFGVGHVTAMLMIEGMHEVGGEDEVLSRLLQIFSNQLYLLSRNELDGLTGLHNRQSFDERIRHLVINAGHQDRRTPYVAARDNCLALLDIDHFKQVNDRYGHLYGDEVLVQFARLMSSVFRHQDMMFRYGGEEFAVVLVGMRPEACVPVLESFRHRLEAHEFPQIGCKTVSIGVAGIAPGEIVDTIINRADKALYYAKHNGRNQVCCYESLVAEGKLAPVTVATGDIELF